MQVAFLCSYEIKYHKLIVLAEYVSVAKRNKGIDPTLAKFILAIIDVNFKSVYIYLIFHLTFSFPKRKYVFRKNTHPL